MNCNWSPLVLARVSLAALVTALFLLACGGESAPPAPPAPPPFQPQSVVVQLGTKGGATTLISTQAGGWTRNGQPFTSGSTITGENAQSYTLTLVNGTWTAQFVEPDPVPLALGSSGDAVSLQLQEDGSFKLGDETLTSGTVVTANNDNQYKLVLGSDGAWTATFEPPDPQRVTLGTSGQMLQIDQLEDGSFTLNGQPLATGKVETALNGNKYTLTLGADDTWSATYLQPPPQTLQLGTTGDVLLVYRKENGTYLLDGEQLLGGRVVTASNGQSYRLSLRTGQDGMVSWVANYQTSTVSVMLGASGGSVNLTRLEDGRWRRGSAEFSSGDTVTGVNGFEYRLTLGADGTWIVESLPATISVTVIGADATTIELARYEDGSFRYDNETVASGDEIKVAGNTYYRLRYANRRWTATFLRGEVEVALGAGSDKITLIKKADGTYELNGTRVRNASVVRSPNTGIRYRLSLSNGVWSSSVYIPPTTDPGDGGGGGTDPVVAAESIIDALPSTFISAQGEFVGVSRAEANISDPTDSNGTKIDFSPYRDSGRYEDDTFVESALRAINKILGPIERQGLADGDDSQQFVARVLVDAHWGEVDSALGLIFRLDNNGGISFPATPPKDSGETDLDEALDDLEDLRDDLSDAASFKSAFSTLIGTKDGDKIFNARKRVLALGSSNNTRYGVIAALSNSTDTAEDVATSGTYESNAFAFSPLNVTETANLPSRGTARYSGSTWAIATTDQALYSGTIELEASIGIERVIATVSNLRRTDNNASWVYGNKEVVKIELPKISHGEFGDGDDNATFQSASNDMAKIFDDNYGGLFGEQTAPSSLDGQFVGTGTGQNAGTAVIGTWTISNDQDQIQLNGSFGAERSAINSVQLPTSSSTVGYTHLLDSTAIDTTTDSSNPTLEVPGFTPKFNLSQLGSGNNTKTETNKKATIRLGKTSLTRFGAWKLEDSTQDPTAVTTGLFAYSQLTRSDFGAEYYPRRVEARYSGRTVMIDSSNNMFDGSYVLDVNWNSDPTANSTINAVISNLSRTVEIGGVRVSEIGFQDAFTGNTFKTPTNVVVRLQTGARDENVSGTHEGFFVGSNGTDGPYGVVGDWSLTSGSLIVRGAFGADLVRSP